MLITQVENALKKIRPTVLAKKSDVELLGATEMGVVTVSLSGECCQGRLSRLLMVLDIEAELRQQVAGVRVVMEVQ